MRIGLRTLVGLPILVLAVECAVAQTCSNTSVGLTPLNDLAAGYYQGYQGGLYPGGQNVPPAGHDSAGLVIASQIVPRNAAGDMDTSNGRIVLLSIGMSNTTQEFSMFRLLADTAAGRNTKLVLVDGAQGGQTAAVISDSNANFWSVIDQRLTAAGVTRNQVQVAWVKEANASPSQGFPQHAQILDSQFVLIARILASRYPNMRIAYWSSRIYAGYATTNLNPEPYAYENGFAVKWTIERQIAGDTLLAYSGPGARSPWLSWGPYLWADGLVPRSDSLIWLCSDFAADGTHPAAGGRLKVAQMLLRFFKSDPTATTWFLQPTATSVDLTDHAPSEFHLFQNHPNPFNPSTRIRFSVGPGKERMEELVTLRVYDILGREVATLVNEVKNPGSYEVTWDAEGLSSGVYLYRLRAGGYVQTRKLLLLR